MEQKEKVAYYHKKVEKKWQHYWDEHDVNRVEVDSSKPKYYVLDMFPYPSGTGLHVGHVAGYTATDVVSRHKKQLGFNVLHPMGWDSFGLPAEQYAVRTGTHPAQTTHKNIDQFRRQLKSLGYCYDWNREIMTSDPKYYKWTQWIFTKLFEKGLAYEAEMLVNYCPKLGTVLANEEVEDGVSKEEGYPVKRVPLKQWILKITAYADRLIKDLDLVDWPEGLKKLQKNWIGRSEGAEVDFIEISTQEKITVFTTCPDTLVGATYMVLAPEHALVDEVTTKEHRDSVKAYQEEASLKSDMMRTELNQEKTGVFTGAYALNPVTGKEIPIWISDYVLIGYGTGSIMAVPAHDQRDFEFATKFNLPIIPVYAAPKNMKEETPQCWKGEGTLLSFPDALLQLKAKSASEAKQKTIEWLEVQGKGRATVNYKLRDWLFSRQRYWGEPFPILKFEDGSHRTLALDELPLIPPSLTDFKPSGDGKSPLAKVKDWVEVTDPKTGKKALRETDTMPQWAGSCWYYLRFCDPLNEEKAWEPEIEKYWMPVDLYVGGVEHAVLHLLYARFWHKVLFDCGLVSTIEPFQRLRNQGLVIGRSFRDKDGNYYSVEDVEEKEGEYYLKKDGRLLLSQIEKMSKSKLNGVSPDEVIGEMGADALRLYEMFMGPIDKEKLWNSEAVGGCRRFLNRFYDLVTSDKVSDQDDEVGLKLGHRLIHKVSEDIQGMQFNTAIAKMMEFINHFSKLQYYSKRVLKMAVQALFPFAPHIAEEMWQLLGERESLTFVPYPKVDEKYLIDETITYVVQVNGKLRGRLDLVRDAGKEAIVEEARIRPEISKYLNGKELKKVIFVPNKLLNFVL